MIKHSSQSLSLVLQSIMKSPERCWSADGIPIFSRPDAYRLMHQGAEVRYHWYDDTWLNFDWSEPDNRTLQKIYQDNARRIRDTYDHVAVFYSGGTDSHTILTTFRDIGATVDEIVYWKMPTYTDGRYDHNFELVRTVERHRETLQQWFPKVQITLVDIDFDQLEILRGLAPEQNPVNTFCCGIRMGTTPFIRAWLPRSLDDDAIYLTGTDKPRLDFVNGSWYAYLQDTAGTSDAWGRSMEAFYIGPDPRVHRAQCHALRRWMISRGVTSRAALRSAQRSQDQSTWMEVNLDVLKRSRPFDDSVLIKRNSCYRNLDYAEGYIKTYMMNRFLRTSSRGRRLQEIWQQRKLDTQEYTGYHWHQEVFGRWFNLSTGQNFNIEQVFPDGWNNND